GHMTTGQGCAVGVVGEPGIGKSRLVFEFTQSLDAAQVTVLASRCMPFTRSVPYALVLDLLRANCGITDLDTPEQIAEKVRHGLAKVQLDEGDRAVALLALLGIKEHLDPSHPEILKRRTFDTLRLMALRGSRQRALVLVIDDLQWADPASQDFLGELASSIG